MQDWAGVFIPLVLFILLSPGPGLLFQISGKCKVVEFGNFHTSTVTIIVHAIIFCFAAVFLVAIGMHVDLVS